MTTDKDGNGGKGPWGQRPGGNPWGGRPPGGSGGGSPPPDIDELLRQAQARFGSLFGGRSGGGHGDGNALGFGFIIVVFLAIWLATGFYRVLPEENGVILTFGKWTQTRTEPGLGYRLPWPVQEVQKVNVTFVRRIEVGYRDAAASRGTGGNDVPEESLMLTGDENIIDIDFVVLWRIADARKFLFEIRDPETTVKKVAESAMREVIGRTKIQLALTEGRAQIEAQTRELMQRMLDEYKSGIRVDEVQLQKVDPPSQVVDAFDDVQRARADLERLRNEADAYANDILPRARGEAQKLLQDSEAYKDATVSRAKGDADRFLSVYKAYAESKDVTARRMYLETIQDVLSRSNKIVLGGEGAKGVVPYLPLNELNKKKGGE